MTKLLFYFLLFLSIAELSADKNFVRSNAVENEDEIRLVNDQDGITSMDKYFDEEWYSGYDGYDGEYLDEEEDEENWKLVSWIFPQKEKYVYEPWYSEDIPEHFVIEEEDNERNLREKESIVQDRKLDWIFVGKRQYTTYSGDDWYSDYDDDEVPNNPNRGGDEEDRIRSTDLCYRNGKFKKSYCPRPPNCKRVRAKGWLGKPKLCINRIPIPGDRKKFYIAAMKCIPKWENCDKCFCGDNESKGSKYYCRPLEDHDPNDDRVRVDCDDIKSYRIVGKKFRLDGFDKVSDSFSEDSSSSSKSETESSSSSSKSETESSSSSSKSETESSSSSDSEDWLF